MVPELLLRVDLRDQGLSFPGPGPRIRRRDRYDRKRDVREEVHRKGPHGEESRDHRDQDDTSDEDWSVNGELRKREVALILWLITHERPR